MAKTDCTNLPNGYFCIFRDAYYSNTMWTYQATGSDSNQSIYVGDAANDQASSVWNHRANSTLTGKDAPLTLSQTAVACVGANAGYQDLANRVWGDGVSSANDSLSAIWFYGNNPCS